MIRRTSSTGSSRAIRKTPGLFCLTVLKIGQSGTDEVLFFVISPTRRQHFTFPKQIEHGGLTDGTGLPGTDDRSEFETGQTFGRKVRVDLEQDERFTDVFGK